MILGLVKYLVALIASIKDVVHSAGGDRWGGTRRGRQDASYEEGVKSISDVPFSRLSLFPDPG